MSDEINRINPTVVEGAEDIHGAETFDADYSPLNRPAFSWRDNMAQSRRTLDKKQVGDMMKMRRMGKGMFDAQGYNDKLDESMGMSKKESKMEQSMKDRRDESKGMEKGMGRRAYQRVGTMDAEGIGSILGNVIPEPHFVGFEEIQMEKMKNQNTKDAESCGNCGSALVMNAEGEHGCGCGTEMDAEGTMLGSIGEGNDFGQNEAEEFGAEHWKQSSDASYMGDKRDLYSVRLNSGRVIRDLTEREADALCSIKEAETFGAERRYRYGNRYITRDSKGRFKKNVDVGRSLSADRRRKAKIVKGVGQGGSGDYEAESKFDELADEIAEQYEKKGKSKEEAEKIGKATAYKVGVAKYGKRGMTNKAKAGMRKKKMGAEEFNTEETMLGSIGEGNDFGQMEAEDDKSFKDYLVKDYVVVKRPHHMARVANHPSKIYNEKMIASSKPGGLHNEMYREGKMYDDETGMFIKITDEHRANIIDTTQDMNFDDGDVVDLTQGVLAKGGVRVGGMTASAIVLAIAGLSGYYYARR